MEQEKEITFRIEGDPVPKARARIVRRKIKGKTRVIGVTPDATKHYESLIAWRASDAMTGRAPMLGPIRVELILGMPIPTSWSAKRTREAVAGEIRPTKKPDFDNIAKALLDGMNLIIYNDDSQVVSFSSEQYYSDQPGVQVLARELPARAAPK